MLNSDDKVDSRVVFVIGSGEDGASAADVLKNFINTIPSLDINTKTFGTTGQGFALLKHNDVHIAFRILNGNQRFELLWNKSIKAATQFLILPVVPEWQADKIKALDKSVVQVYELKDFATSQDLLEALANATPTVKQTHKAVMEKAPAVSTIIKVGMFGHKTEIPVATNLSQQWRAPKPGNDSDDSL